MAFDDSGGPGQVQAGRQQEQLLAGRRRCGRTRTVHLGQAGKATAPSSVGVVLEDGSEPGPVYFDVGSGGDVSATTLWHAHDGWFRQPRAATLRGACSCGWRGAAEYPLNWALLGDERPLYEAEVVGVLMNGLKDVRANIHEYADTLPSAAAIAPSPGRPCCGSSKPSPPPRRTRRARPAGPSGGRCTCEQARPWQPAMLATGP